MRWFIAFMAWQIEALPYIFALSIFGASIFAAIAAYCHFTDEHTTC
jgi:hypothetical protein